MNSIIEKKETILETVRRESMKQNKIFRILFIATVSIFIVFFIGANAIENYYTERKTLLLVNGANNLADDQRQQLNVNAIGYGIWDDEQFNYQTNHNT